MSNIPHRTLIRRAIVRVLEQHHDFAKMLASRICANRFEHWQQGELPACAVYSLSEDPIDSDRHPDPEERRLDITVELLTKMNARVDDTLDKISSAVEAAMQLDAIGNAMGEIANEALAKAGLPLLEKLEIDGELRWPVDTLLLIAYKGTELAMAVDGQREVGVAAMNYTLEYAMPQDMPNLPDFVEAVSGWDVAPADGVVDMHSRVEFEQD